MFNWESTSALLMEGVLVIPSHQAPVPAHYATIATLLTERRPFTGVQGDNQI